MWIFLAALTVLFLAAIAGYLVVRLKASDWPPPGMPRLPGGLWLATLVLLAGSITIELARRAIRRGERCGTGGGSFARG
jgi:heme/copper-type cytochrome/quinol oxidase subunit 3